MKILKLFTLTQYNTSPFIIVAVCYFLILGSPFFFFLTLKGRVHFSQNEEYPSKEKVEEPSDSTIVNHVGDVAPKDKNDWKNDADSRGFVLLTRLAIFSAVIAFGALGAAVSLITRARNKAEIGNITPFELISIQTIGGIFAGILTLIFIGDFIGGRLFPEPDLFFRIIYVHAAFAKLLIWGFIAGFSERFVPNILNNLVKQANDKNIEKKPPADNS